MAVTSPVATSIAGDVAVRIDGSATPAWVPEGADWAYDFQNDRYWVDNVSYASLAAALSAGVLTYSGGDNGSYTDAAGAISFPGTDVLRRGDRGALIEPAFTNISNRSEDFNTSPWVKQNTTVTVNDAVAPDGTTTADKLLDTSANNFHRVVQDESFTAGLDYIFDVAAKAAEHDILQLSLGGGAFGANRANFDLTNGVLGSVSGCTAFMEALAEGFYKCSISDLCSSTTITDGGIIIAQTTTDAALPTFVGSGTDGIHIWGSQMGVGNAPSSYVKSGASNVTRTADAPVLLPPADTYASINYVFDDDSEQAFGSTVIGGGGYAVPTDLDRPYVAMVWGAV